MISTLTDLATLIVCLLILNQVQGIIVYIENRFYTLRVHLEDKLKELRDEKK